VTRRAERTGRSAGAALAVPGHRMRAALEKRPRTVRWLLCGPVSFLTAAALMGALPVVLPDGEAGIEHLFFPILPPSEGCAS